MKNKTIDLLYLVDDDHIFQFLTGKILEETNMVKALKIFNNGLDALTFIKESKKINHNLPDVILLDLSMPIMDGWEFLEEYILLQPSLEKSVTIYIISSSISPSDIQRAKTISAVSDYLIKPVSREKFIELLEEL